MGQIGRLIGVGVGKESTRGAAAAPAFFLPLTEFDFDDKNEVIAREGRKSVLEMSQGGDVVKKWSEGSMSGNLYSKGIGLILLSALGKITTAVNGDASGNVYDHTFAVENVTNPNIHQSLTVSLEDNEAGDKEFTNAVVSSFELAAEEGSYITWTAGFMGNTEAAATETASFPTETVFRPQDMTFKLATLSGGLGAAPNVGIKTLNLSIEKNVEANYNLGSTSPSEFFNKQITATLEVELIHVDDTYRDLWKAGTTNAFQINILNTDVTIGTAENPGLTITCYQGQIMEWTKNQGNDDVVTETLSIRLDYSIPDSKSIDMVLTNLTVSY